MKNNDASSLGTYYAHHRAPVILSQNKDREIGRVFAEYKDKLIIVERKSISISENSLKQFEFF
jgi:hypothetical protein